MTAPITDARLADLRALAEKATPNWKWWTSNSWLRLSGGPRGREKDGGVICPFVSRSDGHPSLIVSDDDRSYIEAVSPERILELLDAQSTEITRLQTALDAALAREGEAVLAEREACARIVDKRADSTRTTRPGRSIDLDRIAAAIRARSTPNDGGA